MHALLNMLVDIRRVLSQFMPSLIVIAVELRKPTQRMLGITLGFIFDECETRLQFEGCIENKRMMAHESILVADENYGDNVCFSSVDDNPAIQTVKPEIEAVMVVAVSSLFNAKFVGIMKAPTFQALQVVCVRKKTRNNLYGYVQKIPTILHGIWEEYIKRRGRGQKLKTKARENPRNKKPKSKSEKRNGCRMQENGGCTHMYREAVKNRTHLVCTTDAIRVFGPCCGAGSAGEGIEIKLPKDGTLKFEYITEAMKEIGCRLQGNR
ncbi:hypothetical protein EAG_08454 [Camponotus floridanus]|uniref:Uncharacterized protein n=1 Tax=Camponotus floridanus TaxID=104421 RepID=E1ZYW7_CAMFO|nr:hypothetical protein EAG_08454 [Camponotus floridanus]